MFAILRKEIVLYLSSMVAYVTISVFLVVLGLFLWVFPDTSILDYGYATLESLFNTIPYLFMFLIPAITMRSLAEERREGTFELLATRPLTFGQIILGKYFACVLLVLFALLPTVVYYYSVSVLGNPQGNIDTGAVIGSYIGLFLLGAAFVAIGLFASAITRNQIIAFTIAVFLSFFVYSGFDSLSHLLSLQDFGLEQMGIATHYDSVSRGVLDTRDLFYFIALSAFFILLALVALKQQMQRKLLQTDTYTYAAVVVLAIIASLIGFTRIDFTKEKRFTLSEVSRSLMDGLEKPVKVTVYLQGDNLPGGFKRLQRATRDMLSDLQAYSHRKLQFQFVDPLKGLNQQQQQQSIKNMMEGGIEPTNLSVKTEDGLVQKLIVPAAMIAVGDAEIPVNLLQRRIGLSDDEVLNNSIQNLEYAFSSAIQKAVTGGRQQIGITEGHHELDNLQLNDAIQTLSGSFLVGRVDLNKIAMKDLDKVKLLVIAKPDKPFSEAEKFKIDQYIMNGGSVLWTIDQVSAELDSLRGHGGEQLAFPKQLNLDDQLFRYGVRINYDLIADINSTQIPVATGSVGGQPQIQMVPWLFYPLLMPLTKHPLVKNLDGIATEFISTIDTLPVKGVKKTVLLTTSPYNNKVNAPHMLSLAAIEQEPDPKAFRSSPKTVAVLLEGKFTSDFKNRPVPEGVGPTGEMLTESKPAKMIVISDGDVLKNQVGADGSPYPLGYDHYSQQTYGNKNLLLNMVDYLTGDTRLIALRNKELVIRVLNRARVRNEKMFWQLVNNIVPPALVLIFAIFQHYIRRRRYAH
ncbi:gliding motility-associated ABC transporter substrate-binding protein GldG [Mucilaginibacter sp. RS28]|uniref:Gliding motility-associated ABC transporter substrate-binding protein GldG n=1 Tax=Mucilaginibacter straminoryzae TaxID=2932774 RepID=A0A9X1X4M2_9SPHI|nr:gliding motility-associated ABC transporter substrate-binding protein GldG [Mucilaginibacter straminoryzae]MCJ8210320.1 gliding motility-associated ABC transporter substrate-binding protein GldG [Mucilaginibacter straminoryzae]